MITNCITIDCNSTIAFDSQMISALSVATFDGPSRNGTLSNSIYYDFSLNEYYDLHLLTLITSYYSVDFSATEPVDGSEVGYSIRFNIGARVTEYIPVASIDELHTVAFRSDGVTLSYQSKTTTSCSSNRYRRTINLIFVCDAAQPTIDTYKTDNSKRLCVYDVYIKTMYACKNQAVLFDFLSGFQYDFRPLKQLSSTNRVLATSDQSYDILYNLFTTVDRCSRLTGDKTTRFQGCRLAVKDKTIDPSLDTRYEKTNILSVGVISDETRSIQFYGSTVSIVYKSNQISTPGTCPGNDNRWSTTYNLVCDQTKEYEASYFSYFNICNYNVTIYTKYACPSNRILNNDQFYDLSALQLASSSHYKAQLSDGSIILFNIGNKVDVCKTYLKNSIPSVIYYSACQFSPSGNVYPISATNGYQKVIHTYNSVDLQSTLPEVICENSKPRFFRILLQCDFNEHYKLLFSGEVETCSYEVKIKTKYACESLIYYNRFKNTFTDLSSLRTTPSNHKSAFFLNEKYYIHYGIGSKVDFCSNAGNISLDYESCQIFDVPIIQVGGFIIPPTTRWNSEGLSVSRYSTDGYSGCPIRSSKMVYVCDQTTDFTQKSVSEATPCVYEITINTRFACSSNSLLPPLSPLAPTSPIKSLSPVINNPNFENQLNGKFYNPLTGLFYDLSPLKRLPSDPYIANITKGIPFQLYYNLFGTVKVCGDDLRYSWTQSCQLFKSKYYQTGYLTISKQPIFSSKGLTLSYSVDVASCGTATKREFTIEFICNASEVYQVVLADEPSICVYQIKVNTKYACPVPGLILDSGSLYDLRPLMLLASNFPFSTSFTVNTKEYDIFFNLFGEATSTCQIKANKTLTGVYGCLVSKTGLDVVSSFNKPTISINTDSIPVSFYFNYASSYRVLLNCDPSATFTFGTTNINATSSVITTNIYTQFACPSTRFYNGSLTSNQVIDLSALTSTAASPFSISTSYQSLKYNIGGIVLSCIVGTSKSIQSCFAPVSSGTPITTLGDLSQNTIVKQSDTGISIDYYGSEIVGPEFSALSNDILGYKRSKFSVNLLCDNTNFTLKGYHLIDSVYYSYVNISSKHACMRSPSITLITNGSPCLKYCKPPANTNLVDIVNVLLGLSVCQNEIDDFVNSQVLSSFFENTWTPNAISYNWTSGEVYNILFKGGNKMLSLVSKYVNINFGNECTYSPKGLNKVSLKDFTTITNDIISLSNLAQFKYSVGSITSYFYVKSSSSETGLGIIKDNGKICYFGETTINEFDDDKFMGNCRFYKNPCQFSCLVNNPPAIIQKDFNSTILLMGGCREQIELYDNHDLVNYVNSIWVPNPKVDDFQSGQFYNYFKGSSFKKTVLTISKYVTKDIHQYFSNPLDTEFSSYQCTYGRELNQYSSDFSGGSSISSSSSSSSGSSGDDGIKNNNKKYITQFDTILKELIKQLSFNICTNVSNRDRIVKGKDFFNHSLNADLKFSLDIGRKDLFWELLDWIEQYMIKNENLMRYQVYQFDSPYESLLPTSTIFSNVKIIKKELPSPTATTTTETTTIESTFLKIDNFEKPIPNESTIKVYWNLDKLVEEFKPITKLINSFNYSDEVLDSVCRVMNVNEIQRFIQNNFFKPFFQNEIYSYSVFMNREDLMSFLLNNFNIEVDFPLFQASVEYSQYLECKFIFENHFEKVKNLSNVNQKWLESRYSQFPSVLLDSFLEYICKEKNITTYNQFIQNDNLQIRKQVIKETIEILISHVLSGTDDDDVEDPNQDFSCIIKNQKHKVLLMQSIIEKSDTQLYFKSALDQVLLKSKEDRKNDEINNPFNENLKNPFLLSFIKGDIKTCNIILKYYPNQFKITKDSITETLVMEKINIIKYYYKVENCKNLINNFKNDNNLLKHLKNQLSNHPIYKYHLTWL
ncbi:hypothetical protein ACTFIR_005874 [Dictyostelium discoideum]